MRFPEQYMKVQINEKDLFNEYGIKLGETIFYKRCECCQEIKNYLHYNEKLLMKFYNKELKFLDCKLCFEIKKIKSKLGRSNSFDLIDEKENKEKKNKEKKKYKIYNDEIDKEELRDKIKEVFDKKKKLEQKLYKCNTCKKELSKNFFDDDMILKYKINDKKILNCNYCIASINCCVFCNNTRNIYQEKIVPNFPFDVDSKYIINVCMDCIRSRNGLSLNMWLSYVDPTSNVYVNIINYIFLEQELINQYYRSVDEYYKYC